MSDRTAFQPFHPWKRLWGALARKSFGFFERCFGLHVTPADFYSPIPVVSELTPADLAQVFECRGIDWNERHQLELLASIVSGYSTEFVPQQNTGLTLVDTFVLYAMIRERKPKVMIEIGAGDSTHISLCALDRNRAGGYESTLYSIDPYPRKDIQAIQRKGFELFISKVQDVDVELLSSADLLFIDSSHVSKIGSDVNYEIFEVLPRLMVGSLIQWHDIPMPKNYWEDWMRHGNMFWNESYILHAFLLFNSSFEVRWASHYMFLKHYDHLQAQFPYLTPQHRLSSFWVERVG